MLILSTAELQIRQDGTPEVCGKVSLHFRPRRKYAEKFPQASARAGSERKSFRRLPPAPEVSGKVSAGLRPRRK